MNKNKIKTEKNKKSKTKNKAPKTQMFTVFGSNANGLLGKRESLINNINQLNWEVFFIQETKVSRKGQIKIENYEIFEVVRPNCSMGGSILTGVHKSLHPVYTSGGEENMEILVIEAKLGDFSCRFMNGYKFYGYLEQEVINAKMFDKLICI